MAAGWSLDLEGREGPRYIAIADAIADAVATGGLAAGDQLPTHRDLADALGVTVGTVTRGYAEARRRGILVGEVGRGTFVRSREPALDPLAAGDGSDEIDLGPSFMLVEGLDEGAVLASTLQTVAESRALHALVSDYAATEARRGHREAGAQWLRDRVPQARPDEIVLTSGGQHGMVVSLAAVARAGDVVLTSALSYPGIKAVAQMLGLKLVGVAMDDEGIRPDALQRAIEHHEPAAVYLVPTIQNPTSITLSEARRAAIVEVVAPSRAVLVEDDAYGELLPDCPPTLAARLPERTIYVSTCSKTMAPGLRVGFVHAPLSLVPRIRASVRSTVWMPAPLMTEVAARWILSGAATTLLERRRVEARLRQRLAHRILGAWSIRADPQGFFVWLTLPEPWCRADFVRAAKQRGILIVGADAFVVGRHEAPHAVRISLGSVRQRATLERALTELADLLQSGAEPDIAVV